MLRRMKKFTMSTLSTKADGCCWCYYCCYYCFFSSVYPLHLKKLFVRQFENSTASTAINPEKLTSWSKVIAIGEIFGAVFLICSLLTRSFVQLTLKLIFANNLFAIIESQRCYLIRFFRKYEIKQTKLFTNRKVHNIHSINHNKYEFCWNAQAKSNKISQLYVLQCWIHTKIRRVFFFAIQTGQKCCGIGNCVFLR